MKRLIFFILSLILILHCSEEKNKSLPADNNLYPDQESWQATILITKDGKTVGYLKAGHVQKFSRKQLTLLDEQIQVDFFNEKGQHTSVLTADGGKVYDVKQDMIAYGRVVVVSDSGLTLFTDTLKWDNKDQKIYSDIPVIFTTQDKDTLYGDSFKSDPDLVNYEIVNPRGKSKKTLTLE